MIGVILIDDAPVARDYLAATLDSDAEILVLHSAAAVEEVMGILPSPTVGVVVVGYHPPTSNGLDIATRVRSVRGVPVVLVHHGWAGTEAASDDLAAQPQAVGIAGVLRSPLGMGRAAQAGFGRALRAAVRQAPAAMAAQMCRAAAR